MNTPHTAKQQNSLHLWFRQCANVCQQNGYTLEMFVHDFERSGIEIPITEAVFKEIYRIAYTATTGHESTTEASTTDYDLGYEAVVKWFAQMRGIQLPPFPDRFAQANAAQESRE